MMKIAKKPVRNVTAARAKILYGELDLSAIEQQAPVFEREGYVVERAIGRSRVEQALKLGEYEVVVLGHTLTKDDRHHLPYLAKKAQPHVRVLVLHASGKHPAVDYAMDSREGDRAVLGALAMLATEKVMAVTAVA